MLRLFRKYHSSAFKEGDLLLLVQVNRPDRVWLTKPLEYGAKQHTNKGEVSHDDIIGQRPRAKVITSSSNLRFALTKPTLDDFVALSVRDAAPIYSQDAAMIVNLADLHVDYPEIVDGKVVDVKHFLEAGTGHGSLTLAIAKQIHLLNGFIRQNAELRGAVLHTIDNRELHSNRGKKNLKMFNRGIYSDDVEFHVADSPSSWLLQSGRSNEEFLSGLFLDMPDPEQELDQISKNMRLNSPLTIFTPSVTQILKVIKHIQDNKSEIRLSFVGCYELQPGGLREWDVRSTKIRATGEIGDVARPKVGVRVVGGGFVALFRKIGAMESFS